MRWKILVVLFVARVGLGFQFQTLGSVGNSLSDIFALDYGTIGLLIGLFMLPGIILTLPAGYISRFVSDKTMVVAGLFILALGGFLSSAASGVALIGFGRIVAGVGFLTTNLYFTKMVADWFEGREMATAMGILVPSWPLGIGLGQVVNAWLELSFGWQIPFVVASVYCFVSALTVYAFYHSPKPVIDKATNSGTQMTFNEWRLILCAAVIWGVFNSGYVIYLSFGPNLLVGFGYSEISAAGVISLGSWLMIFSNTICGQIVDRYGHGLTILSIGMGSAVLSLMLLSIFGAGLSASLLLGILGMAPAGVIMSLAGTALRPQVRASGMAAFYTIYFAFMALTPPIAGRLIDIFHQDYAPIILAIFMFGIAVPISLLYRYFAVSGHKT